MTSGWTVSVFIAFPLQPHIWRDWENKDNVEGVFDEALTRLSDNIIMIMIMMRRRHKTNSERVSEFLAMLISVSMTAMSPGTKVSVSQSVSVTTPKVGHDQ